jgi:DegV family protein with EDD domain
MRVALVTDSTADLSLELVAAYPIFIVPTILVIDGQNLEDGPSISREHFYTQLPSLKNLPTTASPSPGVFMELYQRLLTDGYDRVVSIHPSSALSGVYNAATTGAHNFKGYVYLVDSGQLSMGIGFQVLAAAEAAQQGAHVEEILAAVSEIRSRIRVVAMLSTLEYARRSGRISWTQASVGQIFQLKPFITLRNGVLVRHGEARSRLKGIQRLYKLLSGLGPLERLAIMHSNPDTDAREMAARFASQSKQPPVIVQVTPVIGTHVGPNGLGFAAVVR